MHSPMPFAMGPYGSSAPVTYNPGGYYSPYTMYSTPAAPPPPAPVPAPSTAPTPSTPSWDQAAFLQAMNNFAAQGNSGTDWIFDSGASSHMSSSNTMLSTCIPSHFSSITLNDG